MAVISSLPQVWIVIECAGLWFNATCSDRKAISLPWPWSGTDCKNPNSKLTERSPDLSHLTRSYFDVAGQAHNLHAAAARGALISMPYPPHRRRFASVWSRAKVHLTLQRSSANKFMRSPISGIGSAAQCAYSSRGSV
jgi:hypothetical protein